MNKRCGGAWTRDSAFEKRSIASLKRPSLKALAPSVASERAPARCSSVWAKTGSATADARRNTALPRAPEKVRLCMTAVDPTPFAKDRTGFSGVLGVRREFLRARARDGRRRRFQWHWRGHHPFGPGVGMVRELRGGEPAAPLETPPQDGRAHDDLEAEPEPTAER